eukprot:scaffold1028_cov135-Cylindrotheca_fusiformis.AAC.21
MQDLFKKCLFLTALVSLDNGVAFVPSNVGLSFKWVRSHHETPRLYSSKEDDELSKLIGKRNQIKRKRKEDLPSEEKFLEKIAGDAETLDLENMDLDKMPEFQTSRKAREPKKASNDEQSKKEVSNELMFTDYYADYVSKWCFGPF